MIGASNDDKNLSLKVSNVASEQYAKAHGRRTVTYTPHSRVGLQTESWLRHDLGSTHTGSHFAAIGLLPSRGCATFAQDMKFNADKMRSVARPSTDEEKAKRQARQENAVWLNTSAKIALNIRPILRRMGMSQSELAVKMNVSPSQVAKILSGKENLGLKTIDKIESALGVSLISVPTYEMA